VLTCACAAFVRVFVVGRGGGLCVATAATSQRRPRVQGWLGSHRLSDTGENCAVAWGIVGAPKRARWAGAL
jgi:hypothetical protein